MRSTPGDHPHEHAGGGDGDLRIEVTDAPDITAGLKRGPTRPAREREGGPIHTTRAWSGSRSGEGADFREASWTGHRFGALGRTLVENQAIQATPSMPQFA